jgi:hypothetical protein
MTFKPIIECDGCGEVLEPSYTGFKVLGDMAIKNACWVIDDDTLDTHFCPDCLEDMNEDDEDES